MKMINRHFFTIGFGHSLVFSFFIICKSVDDLSVFFKITELLSHQLLILILSACFKNQFAIFIGGMEYFFSVFVIAVKIFYFTCTVSDQQSVFVFHYHSHPATIRLNYFSYRMILIRRLAHSQQFSFTVMI